MLYFYSFLSVPPNTPQVSSGDRRIDTSGSKAGVYNENDIMNLTCISTGGNGSWKIKDIKL